MQTYKKKCYIIILVIAMNIYRPILGELIEIINIHADIEKYRQDGISIENKKILKLEEIDLNCEDVEFEKCVFKDCKIKGSFEKAVFHDVVFENCDFSNCLFREGSFIRVEMRNCKMLGCDFSDSRIYHMASIETFYEYANFSNANLEEVVFNRCDLTNTSLSECKIKHVYFENSKLIRTQFFKTNLANVDISTCEIEGLVVRIEDMHGLIVNSFQAIELSKLIGIVIK